MDQWKNNEKRDNNRPEQLNPNNPKYKPRKPQAPQTEADIKNRDEQLNPNNPKHPSNRR